MKKYALMLAVALLATPVLATVTVSVVDVGAGSGKAEVRYAVAGEAAGVAAFAVRIDLTAGTIVEVNDFHVGVSVAGDAGYGIFPANFDRHITVDGQGNVNDWSPAGYTPVADPCDKGATGTGIGTGSVILEMGALYKGDGNKPAASGVLCTITVSESCTATPSGDAMRGEVVLEGAGAPSNVVYVPGDIVVDGGECFPSSDPKYADWVALGKPDCWCLTTQCQGDADGRKEGGVKTGFWRVHFRDLNTLLAGWNTLEPATGTTPSGPGITTVSFTDGVGTVQGACADFAHNVEGGVKTGFYRVHFADLNILIANWSILEPATGTTPSGPGIPRNCPGNVDPLP